MISGNHSRMIRFAVAASSVASACIFGWPRKSNFQLVLRKAHWRPTEQTEQVAANLLGMFARLKVVIRQHDVDYGRLSVAIVRNKLDWNAGLLGHGTSLNRPQRNDPKEGKNCASGCAPAHVFSV